ncbi:lytic transglycosylase domain-containing protein [Bradyrhizobium sp.]
MALLLLSGLAVASVMPTVTMAQSAPIASASARDPYAAHIADAATRFRLPAVWIRAVMRAESAGDPRAISSKGAMGLMQIMPETWAELRARHRLGADPNDARDNIIAGAGYIRELLDRYGSPGWIAAYNAGPGRYDEALNGRPLPTETRAYVAAVTSAIGAGGIAMAVTDPLAWTRAPLFIVQPNRRSAADPALAERLSVIAPNAAFARDLSPVVPRSGGLFVAHSGDRTAP